MRALACHYLTIYRFHAAILSLLLLACDRSPKPSRPPSPTIAAPAPTLATAAASTIGWQPLPAEPREARLASILSKVLSQDQLRRLPLDDELSKTAFGLYMKHLDGGKMFLLQEHADALKTQSTSLDDQLLSGNLLLGRLGEALLAERVAALESTAAEILKVPFDYSVEEVFETDAEKRAYAGSEEELKDRWRRSLKLQVLERISRMESTAESLAKSKGESAEDKKAVAKRLAEIPTSFPDKEKKAREELAETYSARFRRLRKSEPLEPAERFLNAICAAYDPHTQYLAPAAKANFDINMTGSLEGIGAVLSESDHFISVRELVPGGASWRQGELEAGDLILAVAQQDGEPVDVADMPINDVVKMIRGRRGTRVKLTVQKPDKRVRAIEIERDVVEIEEAFARGAVLQGAGAELGYIELPSFYGSREGSKGEQLGHSASADVRRLAVELAKRNVKGLILDLRGNGGGLLSAAVEISGLFIETGPIVQTRRSDGATQVLNDEDPQVVFKGPLLVLVNQTSASASEILAAALQDYGRAVIVGTGQTHGKGTVQTVIDLDRAAGGKSPPLGMLKLTVQQFFGIDGDSTQSRGVSPDILLPDPYGHIELGERFLENSLPAVSTKPLKFSPWTLARPDIQRLRTLSAKRVSQVPAFAKLGARTVFLERRNKETEVPLERNAWIKRRDSDEAALKSFEVDESDEKAPARFSVQVVGAAARPKADASGRKGSAAERLENWRKNKARDPWLEEAQHILADVAAAAR